MKNIQIINLPSRQLVGAGLPRPYNLEKFIFGVPLF